MNNQPLHNSAAVLAAIPSLMGYVPDAAVIAVMQRHTTEPGFVVRCTIAMPVTDSAEQAAALPDTCGLTAAENAGVILIAIAGQWLSEQARTLLDALRDAFTRAQIPVTRRLLTPTVATASQWIDLDSGETGATIAYTDSIHTAHAVAAGRRISPSREDILEEFAETTPAAPLPVADNPAAMTASTIDEIAAVTAGTVAAKPTLATRAGILITTDPRLRDVLLLLGIDTPLPAAATWTRLAAQLRGAARVEALTIAAALYYLSGDPVRAGVALETADDDAARAEIPYPLLARLLTTGLQHGLSPHQIRQALTASHGRLLGGEPQG